VSRNGRIRYAVCVDNEGYEVSLDLGKVYQILPTEKIARDHGQLRVIDNEGEDYLYAKERFVDIKLPKAARNAVARGAFSLR
jgi:hypothetical protein